MPSSIICSTKILTLAITPFLFLLVGVLCEFAMVPGVYILSSPQEEEVHYSILRAHMYIHIQQHIHQKDLNLCLTSNDYAKIIDELEEIQTRTSAVL